MISHWGGAIVVNLDAKPIFELAKGVNIKIRDWSESTNFMALALDDFQVVLGVEFLQEAKVACRS